MKNLLIYLSLLLSFSASIKAEVEFTATAPRTVIQGSRFQLVYSINDKGSDLRVADIQDFQILMGPSTSQSSSVQIVNGQVSRNVNYSFTYILSANKVGKFTIAPATINVNGKSYESNSVVIEVIESDQPLPSSPSTRDSSPETGTVSGEELMVTVTANKTSVYRDEPILLTTKIYTRVNLEGISDVSQPDLRDFIVQELPAQSEAIQWTMQNIDGRTYQVGTFNQKVLYPQKTGKLEIEPTSIEFMVRQKTARQSPGIFGDFFDSYRTVKNRVRSKGLSIQVKPLPEPRPANFSGVVGDVTLQVSASKTEAKVNDGITIKAVINGVGNHKLANHPDLNIPADFDVFDPKVTNNITETAQGGKGSRTIETLIIPRHSGTFEIPPVNYSIFNPKAGKYQTLTSKPITLTIERGEGDEIAGSASPAASNSRINREDVKFLGKDIRFIKTNEVKLTPINTFLFGSIEFILGYIIPLLLFVLIYLFNQKRIKENADIGKVKNKRANKVARKRLKRSAILLKKDDQEGFYEELSRALWGYVSDKLSIPPSQLTKDNVRTILLESGGEASASEEFLNILDTCEYARYAPQNDHSERDQMYKTTLSTISQLENTLKRKR